MDDIVPKGAAISVSKSHHTPGQEYQFDKARSKRTQKRSHHLDIRYFFITDQVKRKNVSVQYQPTDDMTGDYMSKPVHGNASVLKSISHNIQ